MEALEEEFRGGFCVEVFQVGFCLPVVGALRLGGGGMERMEQTAKCGAEGGAGATLLVLHLQLWVSVSGRHKTRI